MSKDNRIIYLGLFILIVFMVFTYKHLLFEDEKASEKKYETELSKDLKVGRQLSEQYCTGCHTYPNADLLTKEVWIESVLPAMGPKMGIFRYEISPYPTETDPYLPDNYYPSKPMVDRSEWRKIIDYYESAAPVVMPSADRNQPIRIDSLFFEAKTPNYKSNYAPKVTVVLFDTLSKLIYLSDANEKKIMLFNENLNLANTFFHPSPVSDIRFPLELSEINNVELLITSMGRLLPTDAPTGLVIKKKYNLAENFFESDSILWKNLARPVESKLIDLNQDGLNDLLISEFGHRTGKLFWAKNNGSGFDNTANILINSPGCIETNIIDFDGNGKKDITALCAQAEQAIYLFTNKGEGKFERLKLLQFHIASGSSSFKVHDFNGDGHLDILYTSGDNADYSTIYKPYHGVYIFLNDGANNFEEKWFYPINGAFDAKVSDFNQDGLSDIAVISFYADYENSPEEGFVYFINQGELNFTPYHHSAASLGRWITMDVADWTGDGYDDVLLGNFSEGFFNTQSGMREVWKQGPHFLLLENQHFYNQ